MSFNLLDTVVLLRDLPEYGLLAGDLGAVVEVYGSDDVEVEFVRLSGRTQALVELPVEVLRKAENDDVLAVRSALLTPEPARGASPPETSR